MHEDEEGDTVEVNSPATNDVAGALRLSKAYEKVTVPEFPSAGEVADWLLSLGQSLVCCGYTDMKEIA